MKIKKAIKYFVRITAFVVVFAVMFSWVSGILTNPGDTRNYQWVHGFYEEPEDSLDAVYIGSSNCYSFWNSITAWENYGITVWPYASQGMMFETTEYVIREARKTQPNALFIVNINAMTNPTEKRVKSIGLLTLCRFL